MVDLCVSSVKLGKASGIDDVDLDHIKYAHPICISLLCTFSNFCLRKASVRSAFGHDVIIPVLKDKTASFGSLSNYRAITLSSVISKILRCAYYTCIMIILSLQIISLDLRTLAVVMPYMCTANYRPI